MKFSNIGRSPLSQLAGGVVIGGLTLATVVPTDTTLHHYLANHASILLGAFLTIGFLGLVARQNTVILFNFLACIVLCSFLKQQTATATVPLTVQPAVEIEEYPQANLHARPPALQPARTAPEALPVTWMTSNP